MRGPTTGGQVNTRSEEQHTHSYDTAREEKIIRTWLTKRKLCVLKSNYQKNMQRSKARDLVCSAD